MHYGKHIVLVETLGSAEWVPLQWAVHPVGGRRAWWTDAPVDSAAACEMMPDRSVWADRAE